MYYIEVYHGMLLGWMKVVSLDTGNPLQLSLEEATKRVKEYERANILKLYRIIDVETGIEIND